MLQEKQAVFAQYVSRLLAQARIMGYEVTLGEAYRPPEMAAIYAKENKGVADSNHTIRLAIDLNLFEAGQIVTTAEGYQPLGQWWENQSSGEIICVWGGRFKSRIDADHFSFEHNGMR